MMVTKGVPYAASLASTVYFERKGILDSKNEMTIFNNPEFGQIRTTVVDGEPWFVGRDVADALGYSNSRKAIADHVDEEDKGVTKRDTLGGAQQLTIINESGLYSLVLCSKLPDAKKFKRWVTSEVLPSIRKHGAYMTQETIDRVLSDPDTIIRLATQLKEERAKRAALETTVAVQNQQIQELTPKASYYDLVLSCPDALPISIIAKDYGWSARRMNSFLHDKGVQYKLQNTWLLYAGHDDKGYTKTETYSYPGSNGDKHNSIHTKWTQKGRLFIYELMKKSGNLPVVEQDQAVS